MTFRRWDEFVTQVSLALDNGGPVRYSTFENARLIMQLWVQVDPEAALLSSLVRGWPPDRLAEIAPLLTDDASTLILVG